MARFDRKKIGKKNFGKGSKKGRDRDSDRGNSRGRGDFRSRDSGRSGGRGGPRGRSDRGGRGSNKDMHTVKCDGCGSRCEVPFKPTEGKPVYCSDCFRKNGGGSGSDNSKQLEEMNRKLDAIMRALDID